MAYLATDEPYVYNDLHIGVVGGAGCCYPGTVRNTFSESRGRVIKVSGHRSFEIDYVKVSVRHTTRAECLASTG
jgi:hypothetical protein